MKKNIIIFTFLFLNLFINQVSFANAKLLETWAFSLENISITDKENNIIDSTNNNIVAQLKGKNYIYSISLNNNKNSSKTLKFKRKNNAIQYNTDILILDTKSLNNTQSEVKQNQVTLNLYYKIHSLNNELVFNLMYSIPLEIYFNPNNEVEYLYYDSNTIMRTGISSLAYDGITYHVLSLDFLADNIAFKKLEFEANNNSLEYGFIINEDTRTYTYNAYSLTKQNDIRRIKGAYGRYKISQNLTMVYTK